MTGLDQADRDRLQAKLVEVELEFDREMRARGFDPEQADNAALTSSLSKLYLERERLKSILSGLPAENLTTND